MAGIPMTNQDDGQAFMGGFAQAAQPADDYTDEERQQMAEVEAQEEERRKMLYQKMQDEQGEKNKRKAAAQ